MSQDTTLPPLPDERAEFEEWCTTELNYGYDFAKDAKGNYTHDATETAWYAWEARAARAAIAAQTQQPLQFETAEEARKDRQHAEAYCRQAEFLLTSNEKTLHQKIADLQSQLKAQQCPDTPAGPRTEFVLTELKSALNAMLTFFGMDEDDRNKEVFDKARQAYDYAQIVMRPLEPWERESLRMFRECFSRWHEKAVAKGFDGVEAMCDLSEPHQESRA